jgi:hypothetical protein
MVLRCQFNIEAGDIQCGTHDKDPNITIDHSRDILGSDPLRTG